MIRFKLSKISHRLTIIYALLFFVALALVNVTTLISINYYTNQTSAQQLELVDRSIINEVKSINDIPNLDIKNISNMIDNVDINLIYHDRIIYNSGEQYSLPRDTEKIPITGESGEKKIMYYNDRIQLDNGEEIGIQVIKDMDNEDSFLHALSGIMLLIDAASLILSVIVGYVVSRNALSPIDKITNQAKKISASNLASRIVIEGPDDELKRLSDTFNEFITRIQYSYEKQNRFTLDASHELATPLAVIKGYIDVIDRWGKEDKAILDEAIEAIKIELSNMTGLMDTLLFLSKGDNEIYTLDKTEFILNELVDEIIRETRLVDDNHTIIISGDTDTLVHLSGDRRLVKQMLRAIVDNSMKYTPGGGTIGIDYKTAGNTVKIAVSDNGIGIPEEDLPHIFDRFYRVDKARSRSIGGSGLGLSIVKWIVEIHQGEITAESEPGRGTKIMIELPV
ncbi:MAG: ATP-binding protein [Massilibacteroides sp.]|nr:ATP-binding protein [Massilibacteroides sp.]